MSWPSLPRSLILFTIALCLGGLACSSTYRNCIRLRTGAGRDGIAAEQCDRECKRGHGEGDYEYLRCLAACPGAEISQNDTCRLDDVRPGLICRVTDMSLDDQGSGSGASTGDDTASRVLAGVGWFAVEALAAAISGGSSSSSSSSESSSSAGSSSRASSSRSSTAKPSHKPAEAKPSRSHTPAKARGN